MHMHRSSRHSQAKIGYARAATIRGLCSLHFIGRGTSQCPAYRRHPAPKEQYKCDTERLHAHRDVASGSSCSMLRLFLGGRSGSYWRTPSMLFKLPLASFSGVKPKSRWYRFNASAHCTEGVVLSLPGLLRLSCWPTYARIVASSSSRL